MEENSWLVIFKLSKDYKDATKTNFALEEDARLSSSNLALITTVITL